MQTLDVDTIVVCAGQNPVRDLFDALKSKSKHVELIGGAFESKEIDAKAAIRQASKIFFSLCLFSCLGSKVLLHPNYKMKSDFSRNIQLFDRKSLFNVF